MFPQTNYLEAYKYETHSDFIKQMKAPMYSNKCIFCSCTQTIPLTNDGGSFRQCSKCNKQFKAIIQ
jgi:hypothetical protein